MNRSEQIDKLAKSLSLMQSEIQNTFKGKQGYGYKYTELPSMLDAVRPLLAKYELALSQLCVNGDTNADVMGVESMLMHSSGQFISSTLYMKVSPMKGMTQAQASGSIITYARRYALAAILGIAQTDTDASPKGESVEAEVVSKSLDHNPYMSLLELIEEKGLESKTQAWCDHFKVPILSELSDAQIAKLIEKINGGA